MAIITQELYKELGFDSDIVDFEKLSRAAEIVIFETCNVKPDSTIEQMREYKEAICYEIELLCEQGGTDAINGFSEYAQGLKSESLGSYSVSGGGGNASSDGVKVIETIAGIPVSSISIMLLRKIGLMNRWAYMNASDLHAE